MLTLSGIENDIVPLIAIGGGLLVAIVAILTGGITKVTRTRAREATKREVAAYVAEGSISPADAEKLIRADQPHWERGKE
ncbi:MAG: hypothetical protein Q9O74_02465 [Planctomycetota bacterium]|nr:hypothetical protein [Planctomycetota bacterium]